MDSTGLTLIAKPFIDEIIKLFVSPRLKKLADLLKAKEQKKDFSISQFIESKFEEYLNRVAGEASIINVLVFPNQQVKLTDIYLPLTIKSTKNNCSFLMDRLEQGMINQFRKILIKDTAGMGKSTLLKFMTLEIIKQQYGIPVIINLRNLKKDHSAWDEILLQLSELCDVFDERLIMEFVRPGDFIFLLDGFDEIQEEDRKDIIRKLRSFIDNTTKNTIILTSRPEPSLPALGDFQAFFIEPLSLKETYELISIYDRYSGFKLADRIIKEIPPKRVQLGSFLENPFLISLLYETYCYTKHIPNDKTAFYDEVYRGLFINHDLSKDGLNRKKKSGLSIGAFRQVLRQLAFDTIKRNLVSYSKMELLDLIREAKQKIKIPDFAEDLFLEDVLLAVPLFCEDGAKVRWTHKSFQDYFAAEKLAADDNKVQKLIKIYTQKKGNYLNVLDLFADIDPTTFRDVIVKKIAEDYFSLVESRYRGCEHIDNQALQERKSLLAFMSHSVYLAYCDFNGPNRAEQLSNIYATTMELEKGGALSLTKVSDEAVCTYVEDGFRKKLLELVARSEPRMIRVNESRKPIDEKLLQKQKEILRPKPQKIIDDKDHPFNAPENFELINFLLAALVHHNDAIGTSFRIDHEGAGIVLQEINAELAKRNNEDEV
jgi:hypothetical protein